MAPSPKNTPFREQLQPNQQIKKEFGKFWEFENDKTKVVKQQPLKEFSGIFEGIKDPIEAVGKSKKLFGELSDKYGVKIPAEYIVGKNDKGVDVVFIVTDKIEGTDPTKKKVEGEEKEREILDLKNLFDSLLSYLKDKIKEDDYIMWDIVDNSQYIYGKNGSDENNKMYLIDNDLNYVGKAQERAINYIRSLTEFIKKSERNLEIKFIDQREVIADIMSNIEGQAKESDAFEIKKIKEFLAS